MDRLMSGVRKAGILLLLMAVVCALTPQTTRSKYVLEETVGTFTVEVTVPADAGLTALPPDALVPDDPQQGVQEPETGGIQQDTQEPEAGGTQQDTQEPETGETQQDTREPEAGGTQQGTQEPETGGTQQDTQEPETGETQQGAQEPESGESRQEVQSEPGVSAEGETP